MNVGTNWHFDKHRSTYNKDFNLNSRWCNLLYPEPLKYAISWCTWCYAACTSIHIGLQGLVTTTLLLIIIINIILFLIIITLILISSLSAAAVFCSTPLFALTLAAVSCALPGRDVLLTVTTTSHQTWQEGLTTRIFTLLSIVIFFKCPLKTLGLAVGSIWT